MCGRSIGRPPSFPSPSPRRRRSLPPSAPALRPLVTPFAAPAAGQRGLWVSGRPAVGAVHAPDRGGWVPGPIPLLPPRGALPLPARGGRGPAAGAVRLSRAAGARRPPAARAAGASRPRFAARSPPSRLTLRLPLDPDPPPAAAAQGDLLSGLQGAASGAVDTIGSAVGSAAGAVTGAVGSVTGAATTTEAPKEEKVHVYDSVADLVMRKKGNDTTVIAGLIEKLADMPEAADVVELLSSPNTTATVFIPRDEELTPEIQAELEALLAAEPVSARLARLARLEGRAALGGAGADARARTCHAPVRPQPRLRPRAARPSSRLAPCPLSPTRPPTHPPARPRPPPPAGHRAGGAQVPRGARPRDLHPGRLRRRRAADDPAGHPHHGAPPRLLPASRLCRRPWCRRVRARSPRLPGAHRQGEAPAPRAARLGSQSPCAHPAPAPRLPPARRSPSPPPPPPASPT